MYEKRNVNVVSSKVRYFRIQKALSKPKSHLTHSKACVRYFLSKFFYHQMIALQKYEKCFLFHLKSSFVLKIFKFLYFRLPLFFSLSAIALAVDPRKSYDAMNYISKNLITHFV